MKVYAVLCQYHGCGDCSSGAHVVAVCKDKDKAKEVEKAHEDANDYMKVDINNREHYHGCYVSVEEVEYVEKS